MQNSTQRKKLQNLLYSDQFCGLCFECDDGINIDFELDIIGDDWSHHLTLEDVYGTVFNRNTEDLASKIICNNCRNKLIQSYKFIQNTKITLNLLNQYIKDLKSKTKELTTYFKSNKLYSNVYIILGNNEETNNVSSKNKIYDENSIEKTQTEGRKELQCSLCLNNFGMTQDLTAHYTSHTIKMPNRADKLMNHTEKPMKIYTAAERSNQIATGKPKMTKETEKSMLHHVINMRNAETERPIIHTAAENQNKIQDRSEKSKMTIVNKSEELKTDISCSTCNNPPCIHFVYLIYYREQLLKDSKATCLDCDFVCSDKGILIDHVNTHLDYRPYTCDICDVKYHAKADIVTHISQMHLNSIQNRERNLRLHYSNKYSRVVCNVECDSIKKFSTKHVEPFSTPMLTTYVCGKEVREAKIHKHIESYGVVTCKICDRSFKNTTLLKYQQASHVDNVQCPNCSKMMNPTESTHLQIHSENQDLKCNKKQQPNITCELCDYVTWNSILLECHMNRYHLKIKPYICHICSKNFVGKHLLKKHIKSHTVDQSVHCSICGKKLANSNCLKSHLRLHTGEKNYECHICGEKFRTASIRKVHITRKHFARNAACPLCHSKFYTLVELRRHIVKLHWKRKAKFDPRQLEGLENHYHLFHDGRRIKMGDEDVDFYLPCKVL